ncbi:MAG TPA: hypothetical protein VFG76_13790 [Candidatus Polarisedimenticolia bacterium]|nr:hypothetical protein [Candidatus Polarisedimenticolia bacterium]
MGTSQTATGPRKTAAERLAFCWRCGGILPFHEVRHRGRMAVGPLTLAGPPRAAFSCTRCGTLHTRADAAASGKRAVARHLAYASLCGMTLAAFIFVSGTARAPYEHPGGIAAMFLVPLAFLCLGRGLVLHVRAGAFEKLESHEIEELQRWLCPGMIRSDVFEVLSRHGWRAAKIRSVLGALRPVAWEP